MPEVFICNQQAELPALAQEIIHQYRDERIFIFRGDLGAGKTTLIKALCNVLEVKDATNSPSFAIVNEYNTPGALKIYHFDFYRIKQISEVYDIGYEEYFYSNNYCFIEWPELVEEILPDDYVEIKIEWDYKNNSRKFTLSKKNTA